MCVFHRFMSYTEAVEHQCALIVLQIFFSKCILIFSTHLLSVSNLTTALSLLQLKANSEALLLAMVLEVRIHETYFYKSLRKPQLPAL